MAFPTILFNSQLGSDTTSSGAGPSIAKSGATARNRNANESKVGFHDSSQPDLSEVATDGSHTLWLSKSGRRWSAITAKKDTSQTTTGNISSGAAILSAMGSTTGMSAGDPISVAGAGAAGAVLYSCILTVDSGTQVTLKDNASTTVTGQTVKCVKNVTIEDAVTLNSATSWAIGGYMKDPSNATQLPLDVKPGWAVEFQYVGPSASSVDYYTFTAAWAMTVAGDTTNGRITIKGSGANRPKLKGSSTAVNVLDIQNALYTVRNLAFDNCNDGLRYSTANAADLIVQNCEFYESDGIAAYPFHVVSTATGGRAYLRDCVFHKTATTNGCVQLDGSIAELAVENCRFSGASTSVGVGIANTVSPGVLILRLNVFSTMSKGIDLGSSSTVGRRTIEHNTMWNMANGLSAGHIAQCRHIVVRSNLFVTITGTAVDLPSGSSFVAVMVDYNTYVDCATAKSGTTPTGQAENIGALGSEIDPLFIDPANFDFRPCANLHWNCQGWPVALSVPVTHNALSVTGGRPEAGYVAREEPIRAFDIFARIRSVTNDGTNWVVGYELIGGTGLPAALVKTGGQVVGLVSQGTPAQQPDLELIRRTILQYMRNNTLTQSIVNREIPV